MIAKKEKLKELVRHSVSRRVAGASPVSIKSQKALPCDLVMALGAYAPEESSSIFHKYGVDVHCELQAESDEDLPEVKASEHLRAVLEGKLKGLFEELIDLEEALEVLLSDPHVAKDFLAEEGEVDPMDLPEVDSLDRETVLRELVYLYREGHALGTQQHASFGDEQADYFRGTGSSRFRKNVGEFDARKREMLLEVYSGSRSFALPSYGDMVREYGVLKAELMLVAWLQEVSGLIVAENRPLSVRELCWTISPREVVTLIPDAVSALIDLEQEGLCVLRDQFGGSSHWGTSMVRPILDEVSAWFGS